MGVTLFITGQRLRAETACQITVSPTRVSATFFNAWRQYKPTSPALSSFHRAADGRNTPVTVLGLVLARRHKPDGIPGPYGPFVYPDIN